MPMSFPPGLMDRIIERVLEKLCFGGLAMCMVIPYCAKTIIVA